jgi:AcrR family transcriptional regulator
MMADMGRWKPDAVGRLVEAALELFGERGFEQTTVAEIAQRAGLTERTFFRYFADKREVLFWGAGALETALVEALEAAPASLSAIGAVGSALDSVAVGFPVPSGVSRRRGEIIAANAELRERERIKLASLASALAAALRRRGVTEPAASLAAEMGVTVFRISFERWNREPGAGDLADHVRQAMEELRAVSAG